MKVWKEMSASNVMTASNERLDDEGGWPLLGVEQEKIEAAAANLEVPFPSLKRTNTKNQKKRASRAICNKQCCFIKTRDHLPQTKEEVTYC